MRVTRVMQSPFNGASQGAKGKLGTHALLRERVSFPIRTAMGVS